MSLLKTFLKLAKSKKIIILALILLVAGFGTTKIFGQNTKQPQYQTAPVELGTLILSVTASGTVSSANAASITTSITGVVNEVYVQNGDKVTVGQNIAKITLDQASQQKQAAAYAAYLSAQNTLNAAKSKMNALQSALFTANQKFVNGKGTADPDTDDPTYIIQRADWLQAESDYNNQKSVIAQAEAALSSAWLSYLQTSSTITAPITGTLTNLTLTPGLQISSQNTSSTTNTTPQTFGNITLEGGSPQVTVNLTEIDVTKVTVGQKATLTLDAFPDKTFSGRVTSINTNGSVSSGVTTYPTTLIFDSAPDTIYPNMGVNAQIITNIKTDVLLVPSMAIQTQNDQKFVQILRNGKPEQVVVETGEASDTQTEIISGLKEGDSVVVGTPSIQNGRTNQTTSPFGGGFGGGRGGGQIFMMRR